MEYFCAMNNLGNDKRSFVFLQGPHGPFLAQLGKMLRRAGVRTVRVGFNRGDQHFGDQNHPISPMMAHTQNGRRVSKP
jgi:capsule polysaccharide modification protein KpsS